MRESSPSRKPEPSLQSSRLTGAASQPSRGARAQQSRVPRSSQGDRASKANRPSRSAASSSAQARSSSRTSSRSRQDAPSGRAASSSRAVRGQKGRNAALPVSTGRKAELGSVRVEADRRKERRSGKNARALDRSSVKTSGRRGAGSARNIGSSGNSLVSALAGNRIALVALVAVLLFGGGFLVDWALNHGRVHSGVFVGDVDLSGKKIDEAERLIEERYGSLLENTRVVIFASDEAARTVDVDEEIAQEEALAEQVSVEEARENKKLWWTNAEQLGVALPSEELAEQAYQVGRGDGGSIARLKALFAERVIPIGASYNEERFEELASDIDLTIGDPRVDFDVAVEEGEARLVEGHDGYMVNRDAFRASLDAAFFSDAVPDASFTASVEYAPLRITRDQAQTACDYANSALSTEVSFAYGDQSWTTSRVELGSWLTTEVKAVKNGYALDLLLDDAKAKPSLLSNIHWENAERAIAVDFEEADGTVSVLTDGTVEVPQLEEAVSLLDDALFSAYRESAGVPAGKVEASSDSISVEGGVCAVTVANGLAPESMTFDEALGFGLVSEVSSFTTEYVNSSSTENRRHNIHHAADIINNSIVQSGGGTWSFNERVGECTTEAGFLGAGAIVNGEYDDAVGGGICQVATTVFNSIYEGGYPIVRRYNHSLYIASYPTGRDAAIAYPDLDLVWRNDSTSDVLMRCSYTDSSLTVSLYSVDQGYVVSSTTGDWAEGEAYSTKTVVDEKAKPGSSRVETAGRNGRKITVHRIVKDAAGNVLIDDSFTSNYAPVTEVIVKGPDAVEGAEVSGEEDAA